MQEGKTIEKSIDQFNLLCMKDKKRHILYGCNSTFDLLLFNLAITLEITLNKEYDFEGSDHFLISLQDGVLQKTEVEH